MVIEKYFSLSDVTNSNTVSLITKVTSLFKYTTEGYLSNSLWAISLNSLGFIPSRVRNPWDSWVTVFLALSLSNNNTFRLARPKIRAAFKPAGPPPIIAQSITLVILLPSYFRFILFSQYVSHNLWFLVNMIVFSRWLGIPWPDSLAMWLHNRIQPNQRHLCMLHFILQPNSFLKRFVPDGSKNRVKFGS